MIVDILPFVLLGAVLGLDVVSFPQIMISRPLVAATITGALAGDAERGLLLGSALELVALGTLPFGASRYPEWGSASVVGGAMYATHGAGAPGSLTLAVLLALGAAWLGGLSMVWIRTLNAVAARRARPLIDGGNTGRVATLQLGGMAVDFLRGAALVGVLLIATLPAYAWLLQHWRQGPVSERVVIGGIAAAVGAAAIWMLVRGVPGARLLMIVGLALGAAVLL
jgi:mannose/fructose/N-acetylgalactosamine-specific phosphotransferase system component IIC